MERTLAQWREDATKFGLPLIIEQRAEAIHLLSNLKPVVIGDVVLKVEPCDWPNPYEAGYQIFGQNALGRPIQDDGALDHAGPLQSNILMIAVLWAECQAVQPVEPEDAKYYPGSAEDDIDYDYT